MSETHQINYRVVFDEIKRLKNELADGLYALEDGYPVALDTISDLDSATHVALLETMARNRQKAVVTAEVLTKLLEFVENAALYYIAIDGANSYRFPSSMI